MLEYKKATIDDLDELVTTRIKMDLARFLCDYPGSDDLRVQSGGNMSGSFLQ